MIRSTSSVQVKPVEFTIENFTLRGNFYIPEGERNPPGVILFHGSGSKGDSLDKLAQKLGNNGIFSFFFNFRGCGKSDGNYFEQKVSDAIADARKALDFFLGQGINHDRIGLVGSSFGGNLATIILPEYPIKSLILKAPSTMVGELSSKIDMGSDEDEHNYFFYHPERWEGADNFKNISEFEGDLLVIEGSNDNIIPHAMTQKYFDSANLAKDKKLEIIKGADHPLSKEEWVDEFIDMSLDWFMETL